jgi:hypothetical protein
LLFAASAQAAQLTLTWVDNSTVETGFDIERCLGAGCTTFTKIGAVPANVTTFVDTTLAELQIASYRVRATATGGVVSTYSNVAGNTSGINGPGNSLVVTSP